MNKARSELIGLHKAIYKRNQRAIEESVIYSDKHFIAYEKRYLKAVRSFSKRVSLEEANRAVLSGDIVYVGDYHTLNQSQRSLLRMLRILVQETEDFVIATEAIEARHQKLIDAYVEGRMEEAEFLSKASLKTRWFFDLWENFKPVFEFARYHHIPVLGIESDLRNGLSLPDRDRFMALQIASIRKNHPHKKIIVSAGDLHIAPAHLPKEVDRVFKREKLKSASRVIFYQNSESIYWKLAQVEKEDKTLFVKIAPGEYCRMHTPPIICQQSYLNWLEHEGGVFDFSDAKTTFLSYLEQIASYLGQKIDGRVDELEVFTCGDLSFLKRLGESGLFKAFELKEMKRQILGSNTYFIPKMKIIYLASVSVHHAAEGATQALRYFLVGAEEPRPMQEAFYASILQKALAFFGSKIINPRRKCVWPQDATSLLKYFKAKSTPPDRLMDVQVARMFLDHERRFKKDEPFHHNTIAAMSVDLFLELTKTLGYFLGDKIFYGLLSGVLTKEAISEVLKDPLEEDGEALGRFISLNRALKEVSLPRKI